MSIQEVRSAPKSGDTNTYFECIANEPDINKRCRKWDPSSPWKNILRYFHTEEECRRNCLSGASIPEIYNYLVKTRTRFPFAADLRSLAIEMESQGTSGPIYKSFQHSREVGTTMFFRDTDENENLEFDAEYLRSLDPNVHTMPQLQFRLHLVEEDNIENFAIYAETAQRKSHNSLGKDNFSTDYELDLSNFSRRVNSVAAKIKENPSAKLWVLQDVHIPRMDRKDPMHMTHTRDATASVYRFMAKMVINPRIVTVIPVVLTAHTKKTPNPDPHMNWVIIHRVRDGLEAFLAEPHIHSEVNDDVNNTIKELLSNVLEANKIKWVMPWDRSCPAGLQKKNFLDVGSCKLWSLLMIAISILNPNKDKTESMKLMFALGFDVHIIIDLWAWHLMKRVKAGLHKLQPNQNEAKYLAGYNKARAMFDDRKGSNPLYNYLTIRRTYLWGDDDVWDYLSNFFRLLDRGEDSGSANDFREAIHAGKLYYGVGGITELFKHMFPDDLPTFGPILIPQYTAELE